MQSILKPSNGRVDIKSPDTTKLFQMYEKVPAHQCVTYRNATEGIWEDTALSRAYFSNENIQITQNGIRAGVYERSNGQYVIGPQDCDNLKIIMRSVFLQFVRNLPGSITDQIANLNKMVIDFCVQDLYGEVKSYLRYIADCSTLVVPIAHPIMADNTDRTLELTRWF